MTASEADVVVGVLALQGSFREHAKVLAGLPRVAAVEVRTKEELHAVDALVIPGGESTTMALIAEQWGLLEELRIFASTGKAIWGTCAGLIFLAKNCAGQKAGGQALIGGLDVEVHRNFFGSQIHSFEAVLDCPPCLPSAPGFDDTFRAVFIRAPAIMQTGSEVEVLATYTLNEQEISEVKVDSVVVAVRQNNLMATAFHPEITSDPRWHMLFVEMARQHQSGRDSQSETVPRTLSGKAAPSSSMRPADLPVY